MRVITPPERLDWPSIFLGGSLSGEWRRQVIAGLENTELIIFTSWFESPDYPDPSQEPDLIDWEYRHLQHSDAVLFWFCPKDLAENAMIQLGMYSQAAWQRLFVGVHPEYQWRREVETWCQVVCKGIKVSHQIDDILIQVQAWYSGLLS
jgi:hypothetical protein